MGHQKVPKSVFQSKLFILVLPLPSRFFFLRPSSSALFFRRSDEDDCRFDEEVEDEELVGSDLVLLLLSSFVLRSDLTKLKTS